MTVEYEHGELKECVLADFYTPEFWDEWLSVDDVDDIRDIFKRISTEILEDLASIERTLQEHGITVHKPDTANIEKELLYGEMTGQDDNVNSSTMFDLLANVDAPMTPGYDLWLFNNKLYTCEEKDIEYTSIFNRLEAEGITVERDPNNTSLKKFPFQSVQRLGNTVWADSAELSEEQIALLQTMLPTDTQLIVEDDNGHNFIKWINPQLIHYSGHNEDKGPDACSGITKVYGHGMSSGRWLNETKNITSMDSFVNNAIAEMLKLNSNKWWVDRYIETGNNTILKEVKAFCQYWVDFTEGVTPFEQDGIALNHQTYMTMGSDPDQVRAFKDKGVDLISVPFRHRYLWGHSLRGYVADLKRT
jgi:hypothetical protein|tara:strand:+ start:1652 stop:2734 length:1083 start_codon:yes stop_codon:yes gene_type:complete